MSGVGYPADDDEDSQVLVVLIPIRSEVMPYLSARY
jgi:hypothetical protein